MVELRQKMAELNCPASAGNGESVLPL